jgi:hypothetical protein
MGISPLGRSAHSMASDGTRAFVLGGYSADEISLIHVFDTSMSFRSIISSGRLPRLRTQSTSSTRNLSVRLSILMRRPSNLRGSHPQVPGPWSNQNPRHPLHWRLTVLSVCKTLIPLYRAALPPGRLFTSESLVRMVGN